MQSETWRPINKLEGFLEVSDLGRVRRCKGVRGARLGHILSSRWSQTGDYPIHQERQIVETRDQLNQLPARLLQGAVVAA